MAFPLMALGGIAQAGMSLAEMIRQRKAAKEEKRAADAAREERDAGLDENIAMQKSRAYTGEAPGVGEMMEQVRASQGQAVEKATAASGNIADVMASINASSQAGSRTAQQAGIMTQQYRDAAMGDLASAITTKSQVKGADADAFADRAAALDEAASANLESMASGLTAAADFVGPLNIGGKGTTPMTPKGLTSEIGTLEENVANLGGKIKPVSVANPMRKKKRIRSSSARRVG